MCQIFSKRDVSGIWKSLGGTLDGDTDLGNLELQKRILEEEIEQLRDGDTVIQEMNNQSKFWWNLYHVTKERDIPEAISLFESEAGIRVQLSQSYDLRQLKEPPATISSTFPYKLFREGENPVIQIL
eukprot:TRINITY_DN15599_c0_g1_i1.p2 TRINITY_DN15599_c0_g1~~TRINITY_DN15599_c0_g1_i1.p2  ORF type:complete len:127 (-),score=27.52 TRINITY_DN15599_c0_g1_i1:121-501(-)